MNAGTPCSTAPAPFGDEGGGDIQYTLGMCFNLGGRWFCSAVIQFWPGRDLDASGPAGNVAKDWYYDARWSPMTGHQPDIVVVPFGTNYTRGQ